MCARSSPRITPISCGGGSRLTKMRKERRRVPGAAQHERSEVMRCRPGTVTNSELWAVPDQRCTAPLRYALHRVRDTRLKRIRDIALEGRAVSLVSMTAGVEQAE